MDSPYIALVVIGFLLISFVAFGIPPILTRILPSFCFARDGDNEDNVDAALRRLEAGQQGAQAGPTPDTCNQRKPAFKTSGITVGTDNVDDTTNHVTPSASPGAPTATASTALTLSALTIDEDEPIEVGSQQATEDAPGSQV